MHIFIKYEYSYIYGTSLAAFILLDAKGGEVSFFMALCTNCGKELNEITGRLGPAKWYRNSEYIHYCLECQQRYYDAIARVAGETLGLFYCCIAFNVPMNPRAAAEPKKGSVGSWISYLDALSSLGLCGGDSPKGFLDGVTDISSTFGIKLGKKELIKAAEVESGRGTSAQRNRWGRGNRETPYCEADYDELDRIYKALSGDLVTAGGRLNSKQEFILQNCARWTLEMQKYINAGETTKAKQLNDMIQTNLASENLRKKDERPLENFRIDDVVAKFQAAGLMKGGMILPVEGVQKALAKYITRKKYPYTLDAGDQILLNVINDSRANDGLAEYGALPSRLSLEDTGEFADNPTDEEKEIFKALGLFRENTGSGQSG